MFGLVDCKLSKTKFSNWRSLLACLHCIAVNRWNLVTDSILTGSSALTKISLVELTLVIVFVTLILVMASL